MTMDIESCGLVPAVVWLDCGQYTLTCTLKGVIRKGALHLVRHIRMEDQKDFAIRVHLDTEHTSRTTFAFKTDKTGVRAADYFARCLHTLTRLAIKHFRKKQLSWPNDLPDVDDLNP